MMAMTSKKKLTSFCGMSAEKNQCHSARSRRIYTEDILAKLKGGV